MYMAQNKGADVYQFSVGGDGVVAQLSPAKITINAGVTKIDAFIASPDGNGFYVVDQQANAIWKLGLDLSGRLVLLSPTSMPACPVDQLFAFGAVDSKTKSLFVTCGRGGTIRTFIVNDDNTLSFKSDTKLTKFYMYTQNPRTFAIQ
jgi:hypothetical protein